MTEPASSLHGCRVVVTRPRAQSAELDELLTKLGATVLSLPTIEIVGPESFDRLDAALHELAAGAYEWVAFLSANAVEKVIERLRALECEPSVVTRLRVAAVGAATSRALAAAGVTVDLQPETTTAAGVAFALGAGTGRILIPRAAEAPAAAVDVLRAQGWLVDEVIAYRTVSASEDASAAVLRRGEFDVVTFTSGSTVRGFAAAVSAGEAGLTPQDSGARKVVCIGSVTAQAASDLGFRVDAVAREQTAEGVVHAVVGLGWIPTGASWPAGMAR
ncbi:MAG: uroporphyrinogen-III synthase [Actinomycetota bacterium]|nr:uroporphyrinogen-III synthase [Actinomycetota bacterium]